MLLKCPCGDITEAGLRQNIAVSIGYLESWMRGIGCVPLFNLMEDAATAEISRAQIWQWIHHKAKMSDGRVVTLELALKTIGMKSWLRFGSLWATTNTSPGSLHAGSRHFARTDSSSSFRRLPNVACV